jgi:hypothetical protein
LFLTVALAGHPRLLYAMAGLLFFENVEVG